MSAVPFSGPSQRILLVDDNIDAAEALAVLLQMSGHEVHVAYDGESALDAAAQFWPSVVVLDIGLPGMDGFEVCRLLRQRAGLGRALLVALTGYGGDEIRGRTIEAGFDHHLTKPVDPSDLIRLVATGVHGSC